MKRFRLIIRYEGDKTKEFYSDSKYELMEHTTFIERFFPEMPIEVWEIAEYSEKSHSYIAIIKTTEKYNKLTR